MAGTKTETAVTQGESFLEKPILGSRRITWEVLLCTLLILFVVGTRLWDLGSRGYEHDESIHAWESWKLATGQGYIHDPVYHGPFMYHWDALIFTLFGDSDYTARLGPALFGIALALLPLAMKKWLGRKGALATMLLIAISPVIMTRSRFIWHDIEGLFFNLVLFIATLRYLDERKSRDLYLASAALVLGACTKATTEIFVAILGPSLVLLLLWQWWHDRGRPLREFPAFDLIVVIGTLILPKATALPVKLLGHDPLDYSTSGLIFSGIVFLGVQAIAAAIGLWWDWRRWLVCVAIFYGIFIPLYTTMFTNGKGVASGILGMVGYWLTQQSVRRGDQPWYYYFVLLPIYEYLAMVASAGAVVLYVSKGDAAERREREQGAAHVVPFVPFVVIWAVLTIAAYSLAGEKMPWLTMHLALPLHILGGWGIGRLLEANWKEIVAKRGLLLLALVPLFIYALASLLGGAPSTGTTVDEISRTLSFGASALVVVILAVPIVLIVRALKGKDSVRLVLLGLLVLLVALTVRTAWMSTYINQDYATEFLVYAAGTPDTALVTRELEDMSRRLYGDLSMKVAYDNLSSWPFVWYLRDFTNAQFFGEKPGGPFDAPVVIVGIENEAGVKPFLGSNYYRREYRLIWWPHQDWYREMTLKSLWNDLKDPAALRVHWDIVFHRKYPRDTTSWYNGVRFAMYVRRDVAQQLWDYGTETLTVDGSLPGDEYVDKWSSVAALNAFGYVGDTPGALRSPKGVAVGPDGALYVADTFNHRVQVFDSSGALLRQWGSEGAGVAQFSEPWGIGVAPNGDVYVADTWNHRIQVFSAEGAFKRAWGGPGVGQTESVLGSGDLLYGPRAIAFDSAGNVYVSDTGNKRVIKYDANGNMITAVGGLGDGDGQMQEPVGLATDAQDHLYVADTWNMRIQVFDADLNYLRQWRVMAWEGTSVVNKPYLAVDASGNVFVSDPEQARIIKFNNQGELLKVWGQYGTDVSAMNLPTGLAVDANGQLWVADSENNRLLLFGAN